MPARQRPRPSRSLVPALLAALGVLLVQHAPALDAQVRPIYSYGANGLSQVLGRLQTTASALLTGAHPDDEDSAFIARTARGDHARMAYLSLNRGEGGQNIIGSELFDALGVIRTEELLQARRLDGGEQFFARTFDYGFSKTRAEAASKWNEREVLGDMVRAIRLFRPLVIYSRFSGTNADGHGHHQLAGYLTPLAYTAAADPKEFPEQLKDGLRPWQARKLYQGLGFRADPSQASARVQTGGLDPVIGRTYAEIAYEGRSQHKTQQMGAIELRGPQSSGLKLLQATIPTRTPEDGVFAGIDTSIAGIAKLAGLPDNTLAIELAAVQAAATEALKTYIARQPSALLPVLADGLKATRAARAALESAAGEADAKADADALLDAKERQFEEALQRAAGVVIDALANSETVTPGGSLAVQVRAYVPNPSEAKIGPASLAAPAGWKVEPSTGKEADDPNNPFARLFREQPTVERGFAVTVAADAPYTQPYWLVHPRTSDMYDWPAGGPRTVPFGPPVLTAAVTVEVAGVAVTLHEPVVYRYADRIRGELRRPVNVVPPVAIGFESRLLVAPTSTVSREVKVAVRASSFAPRPLNGTVLLTLPAGWTSTPAEAPLALASKGDNTALPFTITVPRTAGSGSYTVGAEARVAGATYAQDVQTIEYPHIQTHRLYDTAATVVQRFDLKVAPVKVGYIMGSGDEVPDALGRMGLSVTMIGDDLLESGNLSVFDTIVVGIRASEARPAFVANNGRLRQYVERGGTLIVQYQQPDYTQRKLAPFPATTDTRVTDETAPVTILQPQHPAFTFPNRITADDFNGWVQERNLYAFTTFDPKYVPLLESHDAGEPENGGGEVYARIGKGQYVYTAYAWFRQLRAGVPGAYRMFANLVSLSKAPGATR